MIEYIILGFLLDRELSGYDIKQEVGLSTANFYDASFGSIYPALRRLEAAGRVAASETVRGGRFKKVYRITAAGRARVMAWLEEPPVLQPSRYEFLAKLFFYGYLPREKAIELLDRFAELLTERRASFTALEPRVAGRADGFQLATLRYGMDYYRFMIDWFGRLRQEVAAEIRREVR